MAATTQTNWKNVNNWHWVEKNCMPWAKDFVTAQLTGVTVEENGFKIETTEVTGFSGDADINQRKGKLITVYDVAFNVNWKGQNADGKTGSGRINVPEFMHDTDTDELVVEVTTEAQDAESLAMRSIVVKTLVPLLKKKLESFSSEMIAKNGGDVHISKDDMVGHPTGTTYKPKPPAPEADAAKAAAPAAVPSSVVGGLSTITMNTEFVCSASDLYNTFLDQNRVQAWSRGPAQIKPEVGSEISLFGGNVSGKIVELVPNKKIVKTWRLKSWPANHFSTVTLLFEEQRESVTLRLTQTEVPVGEKDLTTKNWTGYYFNGIKSAFG
ncbi:activator of Hsp90 ATPase [Obelidium mucronatum]|nr:activator of Hsp90 ATPase [Obelidium mucronatum]